MGALALNTMSLTILIVIVATTLILAIVLPIVLDSGSSKQNSNAYTPLLAPGHSRTY
jgi:type IV secretory pathway VirB3-like protein